MQLDITLWQKEQSVSFAVSRILLFGSYVTGDPVFRESWVKTGKTLTLLNYASCDLHPKPMEPKQNVKMLLRFVKENLHGFL